MSAPQTPPLQRFARMHVRDGEREGRGKRDGRESATQSHRGPSRRRQTMASSSSSSSGDGGGPSWASTLLRVVTSLSSRADAVPFRQPVDWRALDLPDYPHIVQHPMDLGTIADKLRRTMQMTGSGQSVSGAGVDGEKGATSAASAAAGAGTGAGDVYQNYRECVADVELVWSNCMAYNMEGSDYHRLAKKMRRRFTDKLEAVKAAGQLQEGDMDREPTIEERIALGENLYRIRSDELGRVISMVDETCPDALAKNLDHDEVDINIDLITPRVFHEVNRYVQDCLPSQNKRRKKTKAAVAARVAAPAAAAAAGGAGAAAGSSGAPAASSSSSSSSSTSAAAAAAAAAAAVAGKS